jgi:hypothetical protein
MDGISEFAKYPVVTQLFSNGLHLLATTVNNEVDEKKFKSGMNENGDPEGIHYYNHLSTMQYRTG